MAYRAPHAWLTGIVALCLLAVPAAAGPCTGGIRSMEDRINAWLDRLAAGEPTKRQTLGAQMHRQPTPRSIAEAEGVPSATIARVRDAMERANQADRAGDKAACDKALAEISPLLAP